MLDFFRRARDPWAYQVPLAWFDQQLPGDLLDSGLHWVWESFRGGKAAARGVAARRAPTALTRELAPAFAAELGEYDGDIGRAFVAFATAEPAELSGAQRLEAIREFAKSCAGPLVAIIYQEPEGPSEFFIGREPSDALGNLLIAWAARLGKPVESLGKRAGGAILRRVFLDPKSKLKRGDVLQGG